MFEKIKYEYEPHSFNRKVKHWNYCSGCGLVALRNPLTEWCIAKGCNFRYHPQYRSKLKDLVNV